MQNMKLLLFLKQQSSLRVVILTVKLDICLDSTQTALHQLTDTCLSSINEGYCNNISMLDLSKGCDVLNRDILFHKFSKYGVLDSALLWFKSYLSHHKQFVYTSNSQSSLAPVEMDLPQGTVLGPILFLVYSNDLFPITDNNFIITYADDSSLGCRAKTSDDLELNMNNLLEKANSWFLSNRLIVIATKSSFMLIGTRQNIPNIGQIDINLNGHSLDKNSTCKLLGVYVDQYLSFQYHIQNIISKVSRKIGLLHRLRQFLPLQSLNTVYLTTIVFLFWAHPPRKM